MNTRHIVEENGLFHVTSHCQGRRELAMDTAIKTELTLLAALVLGLASLCVGYMVTHEGLCDTSNEGTDYWYEVCMNDGEIDLGADQD